MIYKTAIALYDLQNRDRIFKNNSKKAIALFNHQQQQNRDRPLSTTKNKTAIALYQP